MSVAVNRARIFAVDGKHIIHRRDQKHILFTTSEFKNYVAMTL